MARFQQLQTDRKSTRLNSSHPSISALFPYTTLFRSSDRAMWIGITSWLAPANVEEIYSMASSLRFPCTCSWIFDRSAYKKWRKQGGTLWLNGKGRWRVSNNCKQIGRAHV